MKFEWLRRFRLTDDNKKYVQGLFLKIPSTQTMLSAKHKDSRLAMIRMAFNRNTRQSPENDVKAGSFSQLPRNF